jgi:peptidyl-prolyl cis-trans isomerase C
MVNEVRASHILVGNEEKAKEIVALIKAGYNFEKLAMEHSKCPSKKKGGDLGWFTRGKMVREFANAAFSAKKNEIVMIKSQFGWHVIKKTDEK